MYGQGNYAQFGQGSQRPMPHLQQRPVATPQPPFHQGPQASQYSLLQQGPPSIPRHVSHSTPPAHQRAPPPPVQQGPPVQVPTTGMLNAGQSYLPPTPPQQVRGSTSVAHPYQPIQQDSQWTPTMHHTPQPVPPYLRPPPSGPSRPEMFRPSLPPRALPTLPSQGQSPYEGPIYLPQPGSVQVSQQILPPLPPPPPVSSFFAPAPFGSFVHSAHEHSNVLPTGPMPPPPPPSSPPPLPPSPPPPASLLPTFGTVSSTSLLTVSDLSHNSESGPMANHSGLEVMDSDSKVVVSSQIRDDAPAIDDYKTPEGRTSCEMGLPRKEDLSSMEGLKSDLPPPPPKPAEEKVVQKIEVLCHFIAKNGPGFEDMARQKEYANPEFEFLFGGKPGSEAAVAHEYFEWMKKKCKLSFKFQNEHNDSVLRPSGIDPSTRTDYSTDAAVSHSPPDSDMDMEDDITQPDEEQQVCTLFEGLNHEAVLIPKELDGPVKHDRLSGQEKGSKLFLDHGHLTCGRSLPKVDSPVTNSAGAAECPSDSNVEKSPVPPLEDLSQPNKSAATTGSSSGKLSGELVNGASPFRLIQDYASDDSLEDDDKPCLEDASPVKASPSTAAAATGLHGDVGSNLQTNAGSMSLSSFDVAYGTSSESIVACSQSMPLNAVEVSPESLRTARETNLEANVTSFATVTTKEIFGNEENIVKATSLEALQLKVVFDSVRNSTPQSGKSQSQKEDIKFAPTLPKVDEFGRLVREGASDSDSDGSQSHYTGRRGKRRRSWSRSRSPHGRRRSPQRRREKRSRSRSWSPKKRRSRSRSPTYRRGGDFSGEKMKRDKGQLPLCFDFLRGRCHRGAFCRYMHHDSNKSDVARRDRSKQQHAEIPHVSRTSDFYEENKNTLSERSVHEVDLAGSSFSAFKDGHRDGGEKLISMQDATPSILDQDDKSLVVRQAKSESSRELTAIMQESRDVKEEKLESTTGLPDNENRLTDIGTPMAPVDTSHGISSLVGNCVIPHSQANLSLLGLQNADRQSLHVEGCSTSDSLQFQTSTSFHHQLPVSEQQLNKISLVEPYPGSNSNSQSFSSQSVSPMEFTPAVVPNVDFPDHHLQLPPSLPSLSQGTSIPPPAPQLPREHDLASKFSSLSPSVGNFPPLQGPLQNLYSHSVVPPNSSWPLPPPPLLPPRPPFVNNATANASPAMQGVPLLQFQHNQLPPRNDFTSQTFVRPYPPELPANSQVGEFQHHSSYPVTQLQDPRRPSLHREDLKPKTLPTSNPPRQSFGGTGFVGEDHFSRFPVPGLNLPNYGQGNIHSQPVPSLNPRTMQSFPSDNLPSGGFFTSSSQNHLYSQQQQITVSQGDYGNVQSTMLRYTSDLDKSQPSHLSDSGGSRIPNYYNPYASTFDQPISSKISSSVIKQEKDMLCSNLDDDAPYSASHVPVDRHAVGSKLITFTPKLEPVDIPRLGSDQYDPLFDSIDPFSNSFKKFDHGLEHESIDDSIRLRLKSHKPLDVLEKDGVLAETTSVRSENDEYGETADAEVGDVENESASNALDATNTSAGEVEIDQVKMPGKRRKSKDSRSMKLFKGALADFVKEVLKPSWRQGNMSKEAFKTIVKKTVDKVSAAMKSHQIPKSQAKINQYIDSSQRKLTKLVMGYVQKYVKV